MTRVGPSRQKIAGTDYELLLEICEVHQRDPSDMVKYLIRKEHERTHPKRKK